MTAFSIAIALLVGACGAKQSENLSNQSPASPPVEAPAPAAEPDPEPTFTGFDLYVTPAAVTRWQIDGEWRTDRLPTRIRGLTPGTHTIVIDPPAGYRGQTREIVVEVGKAPKIEIVLDPQP